MYVMQQMQKEYKMPVGYSVVSNFGVKALHGSI